jgi:hypothetical protein
MAWNSNMGQMAALNIFHGAVMAMLSAMRANETGATKR